MRTTTWAKGILAGAMVLGSTAAFAGEMEDGKWGVALNGGFNTHAMTDVNNQFTAISPGVTGGSDISSGEQGGIEAKYRIADNWAAGLEANYLIVGNTDNYTAGGNSIGSIATDLDATEILLNGSYVFPSVATGLDLRVGLGVGFAMLTGANYKFTPSAGFGGGSSSTTDLAGSGFDGKVFVAGDYYFMPALSLGLNIGYRYAAMSPITLSGSAPGGGTASGNWQNSSGTNQSIDFSGLNTQLALTWWIQ